MVKEGEMIKCKECKEGVALSFLIYGYCPPCAAVKIKELEDTLEKIKQDIYEPDKILIHLERNKALGEK